MGAFSTYLQTSQIHPSVVDWTKRVVKNGGALPGQKTVSAANNFYVKLVSDNIVNQITMCGIVAPDNLVACMTPFIKVIGPEMWTNANFLTSDLTINGLKGNGSKYIDSGIIPSQFATTISNHLGCYISLGAAAATTEIGCAESGTSNNRLYANYSDQKTYYMAFGDGGNISVVTGNPFTGYVLGSVIGSGAGDKRIYTASSTLAHSIVVDGTTDGNVPTGRNLALWATNEAGSITNRTTKRLSFITIGKSLNTDQSLNYFNAIQKLRQQIGGGYV